MFAIASLRVLSRDDRRRGRLEIAKIPAVSFTSSSSFFYLTEITTLPVAGVLVSLRRLFPLQIIFYNLIS
ncbi:hypothetical protein ACOSQ3_000430 [Xanthoceras sorbifolium]